MWTKVVQNVKFLPVKQNSNLSLKLNSHRQREFRSMLNFQNRVQDIELLKFHINWDNQGLSRKKQFSTEARLSNLRQSLDSWH